MCSKSFSEVRRKLVNSFWETYSFPSRADTNSYNTSFGRRGGFGPEMSIANPVRPYMLSSIEPEPPSWKTYAEIRLSILHHNGSFSLISERTTSQAFLLFSGIVSIEFVPLVLLL